MTHPAPLLVVSDGHQRKYSVVSTSVHDPSSPPVVDRDRHAGQRWASGSWDMLLGKKAERIHVLLT